MPVILTKAEVAELKQHVDDDGCFVDVDIDRVTHTIEAMAALLERWDKFDKADALVLEELIWDTDELVRTYHGTETKEQSNAI